MATPTPKRLRELLLDLGMPPRAADGIVELVFAVSESPAFIAAREARMTRAEVISEARRLAAEKRWGLPLPYGEGITGDANSTVLHPGSEKPPMQNDANSTMQNDANSMDSHSPPPLSPPPLPPPLNPPTPPEGSSPPESSPSGGEIPSGSSAPASPTRFSDPSKGKRSKREPSPAQRAAYFVWMTYREEMQRVHGVEVGARPDPLLRNAARFLSSRTQDEQRELIRRFAEDRDPFLVTNGWSIRFMPSRLQAYAVAEVKKTRRPKESFASVSALTPEMASARRIDASAPEWVREVSSAIEFGDEVSLYLVEAVAEWREGQDIPEPPAWRERLKPAPEAEGEDA